jgi:hypothetical protein
MVNIYRFMRDNPHAEERPKGASRSMRPPFATAAHRGLLRVRGISRGRANP